MPRSKQGTKTAREARNRAFQQQLRERKRMRRERAAKNAQIDAPVPDLMSALKASLDAAVHKHTFNEAVDTKIRDLPILDVAEFQQSVTFSEIPPVRQRLCETHRPAMHKLTVSKLRDLATFHGVEFTTRTRKADLIDRIIGGPNAYRQDT